MKRTLLLSVLLVLSAPSPPAEGATFIAYDPYAQVSWGQDIRCKTAFHTHTDVIESRIRAYDDAGYCAVSFHQYTGVPGLSSAWKVVHWPPEQWMSTAFLASLQNIRVLIPDGEHPGWDHFTSPFLTSYLECYQDSTSRLPNPLCRQTGDPREAWHYSNVSQLVDRIHQFGGLATIAHNIAAPAYRLLDPLPADLMEICSAHAEYNDWVCDNTASCPGWNDGPARMMLHYDDKLKATPRTWAICVNDWHGPGVYNTWNPPGPEWINDSGYTLVLTPQVDLATLKQRVSGGAMLAVQDRGVPKGTRPEVVRIDVEASSIHVEATGYTSILWIHNGVVVGAQPDIDVSTLAPGTIRAELRDAQGSVVFTQPWELWVPRCSNGADDDGDGHADFPTDPGCASAASDLESPACDDGLDNDGDGAADLADSFCGAASDDAESPPPACANGVDDDGDGFVDLADAHCEAAWDDDEQAPIPACSNGLDDDGDLLVDLDDPDCAGAADDSEMPLPACSNGVDDDVDGLVDFPADPDCVSASHEDEWPLPPACQNGVDDDLDGLADLADPDCSDASDPLEGPPPPPCSNEIDDDADGLADYPADPGCREAASTLENPQCDDGLDNDGDGKVDWDGGTPHAPADTYCTQPFGNQEQSAGCGLGAELLVVLPALAAGRARRGRRARG